MNYLSETMQDGKVVAVFSVFKERILGTVGQMVGIRVMILRKRSGKLWWTDSVREAFKLKREVNVRIN